MWAHDVYKKPFPICSMYGIFMEDVPALCINLCIATSKYSIIHLAEHGIVNGRRNNMK